VHQKSWLTDKDLNIYSEVYNELNSSVFLTRVGLGYMSETFEKTRSVHLVRLQDGDEAARIFM